jgi:hypothetical protein
MFPIGRNERYFVAIWIVDQESRYAIIHRMNNEIASVRLQLFLCNGRDLSVERFSRRGCSWTQLSNCLIAAAPASRIFCKQSSYFTSKLIPRFGAHVSLGKIEKLRIAWTRYAITDLEPPSVCLLFREVQIDNRPLANLDDKVNGDFSGSRRPTNDRVGPNGKRNLPGN